MTKRVKYTAIWKEQMYVSVESPLMSIMQWFVNRAASLYNAITSCKILRRRLTWSVMMLITGESLARGVNTTPDVRLDINARGLDRVPYSLMYGCVTQMRNLTRTSPLSKYIARMKTRRNVCTQAGLWKWNKPRSHRWCSPLQVAWHPNVKSIMTSD